jgi:hypothetical protein
LTRYRSGVFSIPTEYELTPDNLKLLYEEVIAFWKDAPRKPQESYFT